MGGGNSSYQALIVRLLGGNLNDASYAFDMNSAITGASTGIESTGNTTTTTLGSAETFTGVGEQNQLPHVGVFTFSDTEGTLFFEFSVDDVNWSTFPVSGFACAAGVHEFHTAVKLGRYFRARFVNSASVQAAFRLYTYYGNNFLPISSPLNQSLSLDGDAISVRPADFQDEVLLGRRSGVTGWSKFGHRSLLAAGGFETIWDTTGNYVVPTVASTMTIAYDGTAGGTTDGAGTTGARVIRISYIDENGLPQTLDHTLETDGSDVTTAQTLGINRAQVIGAGALTYNANNITITATTGGAKLAVIPAENGVTQQSIFHVGSNHQALFKFLFLHMNKAGGGSSTVAIRGYVYNRALAVRAEVFRMLLDDTIQVQEDLNPEVAFLVPATGVLYFEADTSRDGVEIVCRFSGNEYQNT